MCDACWPIKLDTSSKLSVKLYLHIGITCTASYIRLYMRSAQ